MIFQYYITLVLDEIIFCINFVLHSLCFGKHPNYSLSNSIKQFQKVIDLFETQIELDELYFSSNHNLKQIIISLFQRYINTFLMRIADHKN